MRTLARTVVVLCMLPVCATALVCMVLGFAAATVGDQIGED